MPTPATRTPIRIARGTYANLNASISDILEGELVYATDQDKFYVKEGASLVATYLTTADIGVTVQGYDATTLKSADIGVSVQGYDADLDAVAALSTTGLVNRTGAGTVTTVTAPSGNIVGTSDTQTLTNKTLTSPTISSATMSGSTIVTGNYSSSVISVAALNIDCSLGNYFTKTISGSSTFTFSNVPATGSYVFVLEVTHSSGTISWPASVKWPADTPPVLTSGKTHIFVFVTDDGGSRFRGASIVDYVN